MRGPDPSPVTPLRWDAGSPPDALGVPVPPARLRLLRGGRPLKRWRYIAVFADELMLCAGSARIGPAATSWWAVWDRARGVLAERTRMGRGRVRFSDGGGLTVHDGDVRIEVTVQEGGAVESLNPHGAQYVWTRKQAGRPAHARVTIGAGRTLEVDGLAVVDDTAGYHARETAWLWSAGVGRAADGHPVGWNLVTGLNDGPAASERSVWHGDRGHEVGPVSFAEDLSAVSFAEGGTLEFTSEAVRERRDRLLVLRSDYRQPFGRFDGTLPGVGPFTEGLGVMERHIARW